MILKGKWLVISKSFAGGGKLRSEKGLREGREESERELVSHFEDFYRSGKAFIREGFMSGKGRI